MRRLPVNLSDVEDAISANASDGFIEPHRPYLDVTTGRVVWVFDSDDEYASTINGDPLDNRRLREAIAAGDERYIVIPAREHADDHDLLRTFLRSCWTDDEALRDRAFNAYHGSIGKWKRALNHDPAIMHPWNAFQEQATRERALAFLAEHGVEPAAPHSGK